MIRTLGNLIEELRQAEAAKLNRSKVTHGPTIGAMYEGLTSSLLNRAIPSTLDLRVVSGFAVDGYGGTSGQLDCMVVRGEGTPVPYVSGVFQWHVRDILAVFEVKKTLFGGDLSDAYGQLQQVSSVFSSWVQNKNSEGEFSLKPSLRVYAECVGEVVPDDWSDFDPEKHLIWHTIMSDQIAPIRVALGYGGYSTESGLRSGFLSFLQENIGKIGYGPPSIPNLIVGDGVSLVKLSGHPFRAKMMHGWWPIVASTSVNPSLLILEHLWTRISYISPAPEFFGEDLDLERLTLLLDAKPKFDETSKGWQFRVSKVPARELRSQPAFDPWEPVVLDPEQNTVVSQLCRDDISMTDPGLISFLQSEGKDPQEFFEGLVATTLVAVRGDKLTLTTTACRMAVLPDGRFVAGEDNSGRFTRWLFKYMEAYSAARAPSL
jgi:hypothetical protein